MYYTYILTNKSNEVLYIGVTNNLQRRMYEHKHHLTSGFTDKYNVTKLVYYECAQDVNAAIAREKQLKKWSRQKKDMLISRMNPKWEELTDIDRILYEDS